MRWSGGRLAIVLSGLGLGGVQRTMLTLAGGLVERGVPVDLVVPRAEGPFLGAVPEGARLVELRSSVAELPWIRARKRRRTLASTGALAAYLRRERPAIALAASHYVNLSLIWARRRASLPIRIVVSQRTALSRAIDNAGFPFRRRPWLRALVRRSYPMADAITAVSDGVADDLARVAQIGRERIVTLPNPLWIEELTLGAAQPVPHPWLADEPDPLVDDRDESGDREDKIPVCMALGRLAPQKDLPTLLSAMAQVRRQRRVRLLVLGEGRERPRLERLVAELGLSEDVALPGYVENPFAWLSRAQLFILSSSYEGLPGALVQALACGCPVVSTDCPSGPREILEDGKLGALVPVGDADALAAAIVAALQAPRDEAPLRRRALDFAREPVVDAWLAWLQGIAR